MEKEFLDYWDLHQRHMILNAPEKLRKAYIESTRMDSPMDWLCFLIPICVGIWVQSLLKLESEILSWAVLLVVVVLLFTFLQMVKPYFSKKKSETEAIEDIKQFYYGRYKKGHPLDKLETWNDRCVEL